MFAENIQIVFHGTSSKLKEMGASLFENWACGLITSSPIHRYNTETGEFTVPAGGGGLYFFYTNLWTVSGELAVFQLRVNGAWRCRAESSIANVDDEAACGIPLVLAEGKLVGAFV